MSATNTRPTAAPLSDGSTTAFVLAAVLAVAMVAAAYLPAVVVSSGFVSDDFMILQRIRDVGGLRGAATFFAYSYYEYFRPVGFLSFALDWSLWGDTAWASHGVSLLLHVLNTLLVLVIARRLVGLRAAAVAAVIFGLHPAHHEAVYWYAARFDLLATAGLMAALAILGSGHRLSFVGAALFYLAALLSKESAVTFPLVAGAFVLWVGRGDTKLLLRVCIPLAGAAIIYVVLRQASGLPSAGGPERAPKLLAFGALSALLLVLSLPAATRIASRARAHAWALAGAALGGLAGVAAWSAAGLPGGAALRGFFTSAGFAAVHMGSPVSVESWLNPLPPWLWVAGAAICGAAIVVFRLAIHHPVAVYLAWFALASLIPVSSMTEGTRYLYLPFVPVAIAVGWWWRWAEERWRGEVRLLLAVVLAVAAWQVLARGRDWGWAATMTREAASTIAAHAAPCSENDAVLATAPARVRGVYCNINYEALQWLQGCAPRRLITIVRLGVDDPDIEAGWAAPDVFKLRVREYRGGLVTSADLVSFSVPVSPARALNLTNVLGPFSAVPTGAGLLMTQDIRAEPGRRARWFVFSNGRLRWVGKAVPGSPGVGTNNGRRLPTTTELSDRRMRGDPATRM